jgi:hypothetical protein
MIDGEALDTSAFVSSEQGADEAAATAVANGFKAPEEPAPEAAEEAGAEAGGPEAGESETAEEGEEQPAPKPKKTVQDRIDEVTRARREAEREAKYWRDVAEGKIRPQQEQERQEAEAEPNPDDYEYGEADAKYLKDVIAYGIKTGLDAATKNVAQAASVQAEERAWEARQDAARSKFADYDQKVIEGASDWPCSREMAQAIRTSDVGGELAYHLASNPEEARRIAALDPFSQIRALGRLEAALDQPAPEPKPQPKTATTAPKPPVNQARGAGGQFSVAPDTDDFAAFEKAHGARFFQN